MASPSVLAPVSMAFETVRRVLFQPFSLVKWLVIGFTAWLSLLAEGLGSFQFNLPGKGSGQQTSQYGRMAWEWVQAHLVIVIPLFVLICAIVLVFSLLVLWLSCRGKFMFLDNVVGNRAEIAQPWKKFRTQGNSCFLFIICFVAAATALVILGVGLVLLVGWPDFSRAQFSWNAAGALVIGFSFFACFLITMLCVATFLEDFVVPIMAVKECRVMEGWSIFLDLFRKDAGIFLLYLLFRAALSIIIGLITIFVCCLLCCAVLIPYVGTVILLPIYVFWRAYSVHFLGQFDNKLRMLEGGSSSYITLTSDKI